MQGMDGAADVAAVQAQIEPTQGLPAAAEQCVTCVGKPLADGSAVSRVTADSTLHAEGTARNVKTYYPNCKTTGSPRDPSSGSLPVILHRKL